MNDFRWAHPARDDIDGIDAYLRARDPAAADRIGRDLLDATAILGAHAAVGVEIDDAGRRKWRVPRTPDVLIYRIDGAVVRILRARHVRQDGRPA